ncbi:MAG: hypothetical protein APR54_02725 [Candidatus Cloacimonas sp. SDB]|nr:MAG: hypothetical protein APR54_02725 [Candidatus Cloacimonas sp. SDB]
MHITIKYLGLNVVYVTMEDNDNELKIKAESSALAGIAASMDNQYFSAYENDYLPLYYRKVIDQRGYQEDRIINYDRDRGVAYRTSYIDTLRNCSYPIHPETRDFFSALFFICQNFNELGGTLWLDANKLIWKADYEIVGLDRISSYAGKKEAVQLKLDFSRISEGKAERSDMLTNNLVTAENSLYLWISNDEKRLPLKAEFSMKPFSVVWKMTAYEE